MALVAPAGWWSHSDGVGDPSGVFSRTSFTISAGDLNTTGDRDFLVKSVLLGGL